MTSSKVIRERDVMKCRACGQDERASEGYPCADCGTFICLPCTLRGVIRCRSCEQLAERIAADQPQPATPQLTWPEH